MDHLNLDWLAELADREPTEEERARLAEHPEWLEELEALQAQTEALGELPSLRPPRGDWTALAARLMSEGLIRTRRNTWLTLPLSTGWTKAAAAVVLFLGGTLTGASFAGGGGDPLADMTAGVSTLGEAERAVAVSEQQYLNSLVRYRELSATEVDLGSFGDPRERAAALDMLVQAGQSALRRAPDDPFINLFLVNTLAEQRATVQRTRRSQDNWF